MLYKVRLYPWAEMNLVKIHAPRLLRFQASAMALISAEKTKVSAGISHRKQKDGYGMEVCLLGDPLII